MSERLKILYMIGSMEIGGTESQMYDLISNIHGDRYKCNVFSLVSDGPLAKRYKKIGIRVYSAGLKKGDISRAPWKLLNAEIKLFGLVRKLKPQIIHCYLPLITFMGSVCGRMMKVPLIIISKRGLATHQKRYPILKPVDRISNRLSHRITVNSKAVWNEVLSKENADPSKLVLIYNGVDVDRFKRLPRHREAIRRQLGIMPWERVIIVIGNLIPYKGHMDLLRAAALVINEVKHVRFLLAGEDRGTQKRLEALAQTLGILPQFDFLGLREDVPRLLAASDISVLPSHEEGFSNVILESMAAGLPVVAARVGGNPEAIVNGSTGWLVTPKDYNALAEKILDLLKNPDRARKWGIKGRERVIERFSIRKMVAEHLALYKAVKEV